MSVDWLIFTLAYFLVCVGIIYPPVEFVSAGLTISTIFSKFLGSESEHFIQYHLRRSSLTIFIHSLLPLGYCFLLLCFSKDLEITFLFLLCFLFSHIIILITLYRIYVWSSNNWKRHPISTNLAKFANSNSSWLSIASDINVEYRRIDKFSVETNSVIKVIATDNWILKVTPYNVYCAHQSDTALVVSSSDTHLVSVANRGEVQFINIEVKSTRPNVEAFSIRLNALDFKDLQDNWSRPIAVLANVTFHRTLLERFIEAFKEQVALNEKHRTERSPELCIGCMQTPSNVKLQKLCVDDSIVRQEPGETCSNCYCRPMWCVDCIARWFASRQDEASPDTWLASKCTCPMCRAKFCIYDVSYITVIRD